MGVTIFVGIKSLIIASLFSSWALAQNSSSQPATMHSISQGRVKALVQSSNARDEYRQRAAYFHQRETHYRAKAQDERAERDRRARVNAALYEKYPRPVDTAESLYSAYTAEADKAAGRAQAYDLLATGVVANP